MCIITSSEQQMRQKMNAAHKYDILDNNDYEVIISRNKIEEIRNDPFGLGNTVKGLTNVNHQRNLSNYAEELVAHYAKYVGEQYELFLSDLPEDEQNELVRLYIEATNREVNECVHGSDFSIDNEYTCALLSMLKNDCQETRENFAEVTRKNTIIYYTNSLQEVLDDACNSYFHMVNNESGYYAHYDLEHGDNCWSKF